MHLQKYSPKLQQQMLSHKPVWKLLHLFSKKNREILFFSMFLNGAKPKSWAEEPAATSVPTGAGMAFPEAVGDSERGRKCGALCLPRKEGEKVLVNFTHLIIP